MANTKVLNLDKLKVSREIVLGEQTFKILPLTVREFIEAAGLEEKLATMNVVERMGTVVDFVHRHVENMDREAVMNLDLETLLKIASFLRGEQDADAQAPEGNVPKA